MAKGRSFLRPRPGLGPWGLLLSLVILFLLLTLRLPPPSGRELEVFLGARRIGEARLGPEGTLLVPLEMVREHFDPAIRYLPAEKKVRTTTSPWRLPMASPAATAFVQQEPAPVEFVSAPDGLVPLDPLRELYGIRVEMAGGRVLIDWAEREIPVVSNPAPLRLRSRPWPFWPGKGLPAGSRLLAYDRVGNWFLVRAPEGLVGYVPTGAVRTTGVYRVPRPSRPPPVRAAGPVCLVWEHVLRPAQPDPASLAPLPGVNVVSPTWLCLADADGTLSSRCAVEYIRWAHSRGYAVWVLVGNDFDPDLTRKVLQDAQARQRLVRQLLVYCRLFALDGINVDFENVYPSEKVAFVNFVEELSRLARAEGVTVSVDVTVKSSSPTWSLFLDRKSLARHADYLALMVYDEHYAGSPRAGSVASLPWVERGIRGLLEEVPAEKLLLGIPFYTRLWKEEREPDGQLKVTSRALGMEEAESILGEKGISPRYDPATGQDYAEWREGGATWRVWLENERSLAARLRLASDYGLAGVAAWRRGFEKPAVWELIRSYLSSPGAPRPPGAPRG